jgi:hypothetical protein
MKRWFSVVLMLWASVAPLLMYAPTANAAGETYVLKDANTIIASGGNYSGKTVTLKYSSSSNSFGNSIVCGGITMATFEITKITKSGNDYSGKLSTSGCGVSTGNITIKNPNGITLGSKGARTETYTLKDSQTIVGHGGDFQKATGGDIDFKYDSASKNFFANEPGIAVGHNWSISGLTKNSSGNDYTGKIAAGIGADSAIDGTIKISNPKNVTPGSSPSPTPTSGSSAPPDCDAGAGFTWIICGLIHLLVGVVDWIRDSIIVPFLKEAPLDKSDPNIAPVYAIWGAFRNVASVFFILIFFLIIFGTAMGFDNYTIKRVLPHLIAGAVLVPFSWYICVFAIDIGNILGQGLVALMSAIIPAPTIDFTSAWSKVFFGGAVVLVGAAAIAALSSISLGVIITAVLAMAAVFVTLVLRKILILLMIVLSPFALLAWVLPNTEKWFKQWYTTLFKLILMYPLIMMLFEMGRLFSTVAGSVIVAGGSGSPNVAAKPILQLSGLIIPLGAVPWTFKWAGGAMALGAGAVARGTGALNKRYGKDSDFAKNQAAAQERKNLLRANTDKGLWGKINKVPGAKRVLNARSGHGGFGGLMNGNVETQLARAEAYEKATKTQGKYKALKENQKELPPEDSRDRVDAERSAAKKGLTDGRSGRAGLLQAEQEAVNSGKNLGDLNRQRYQAGQIAGYRGEADGYGQAQGVIDANAANPQSVETIANAAAFKKGLEESAARGVVGQTAASNTELNLERAHQTGLNARDAYLQRLGEHAAAAAGHTKEELGTKEGAVLAHEEVEHNDPESTVDIMNSSTLEQREKLAEAKKLRMRRVQLQSQAQTRESTADILKAADTKAQETLTGAYSDRKALRDVPRESDDDLLDASNRVSEQRRADVIGVRQGVRIGERELNGTPQQQTPATRVAAATEASRKAAAAAAGKQRGLINDRDADYRTGALIASAAAYNTGKSLGTEAGLVDAANNAAAAEARADGFAPGSQEAADASIRTAAGASDINNTDKLSKAFALERAANRVAKTRPVSADQIAEVAQREAEDSLGKAAGVTIGKFNEGRATDKRLIDAAAAKRETLDAEGARRQLIDTAVKAGTHQGELDMRNMSEDTRGIVEGHDNAIQNEIDAKDKDGVTISRDTAAKNILNNIGETTRRAAAQKVADTASGSRGNVETYDRAIQAQINSAPPGPGGKPISRATAQRNLVRNADAKAAQAAADNVNKEIGAGEGAAKGAEQAITDNMKATGADRKQAQQNLVSNAVADTAEQTAKGITATASNARGDVKGRKISTTNAKKEINKKTGRAIEDISDDEAEAYLARAMDSTTEREGLNKTIGTYSEAMGTADKRDQQIKATMADDPTLTAEEADELIADAGHTKAFEDAGNKVLDSTAKDIADYRALQNDVKENADKLQAEADAAGKHIDRTEAENQARQKLDNERFSSTISGGDIAKTKEIRQARAAVTARNAAIAKAQEAKPGLSRTAAQAQVLNQVGDEAEIAGELAGGALYGQAEGVTDTVEANIKLLEQNTVADDTPIGEDVILADGTIIKGTADAPAIVPAGKTVLPGTKLPPGTRTITRAEAKARYARNVLIAGREAGIRQQTQKQGNVDALAQISEDMPSIEERQAAVNQNEIDTEVDKIGKINSSKETAPGADMFKDVKTKIADETSVQRDRILDKLIVESSMKERDIVDAKGNVLEQGIRLRNLSPTSENIPGLKKLITDSLHTKDYATASAAVEALSRSDSGRNALAELRVDPNVFNGNEYNKVDQEYIDVFNKGTSKVNVKGSPDLVKPAVSAFGNITADDLVQLDRAAVTRYVEFIHMNKEKAKQAKKVIDNPKASDKDKRQAQKVIDTYARIASEAANADFEARNNPDTKGKYKGEVKRLLSQLYEPETEGGIGAPAPVYEGKFDPDEFRKARKKEITGVDEP